MQSFQTIFAQFTWLDVLIIMVFLFYAVEGYSRGLLLSLLDFISFVLSFVLGLSFYHSVATFLVQVFSISLGFANAIGFFLVATISEMLLNILFQHLVIRFSRASLSQKQQQKTFIQKANNFLGILPGLFSAFVLVSFIVTVIVSLPLSEFVKRTITASPIANMMLIATQGMEKHIKDVFGGAVTETMNFLTVEPESDQSINLKFTTTNVQVSQEAENQMLVLVNKERTSRGLQPLVMDSVLTEVGREHSKDMFARGYFSHYTPEGFSPFDRMAKANVVYTSAGENLALAPSVELAMQGLMQSPGHRANILSPSYHKIGIGAIDGGIYGIMFSQEFTD